MSRNCPIDSLTYQVHEGKKYYTVQEGDSLYEIAKVFKLSLNSLKKMNAIRREILHTGRNLWWVSQVKQVSIHVRKDTSYRERS